MRLSLFAIALLLLPATACAQSHPSRTLADDAWCEDAPGWGDRATACEVRETVLRTGALDVEVENGGLTVTEWDRPDVLVRARVVATADDEAVAWRRVRETTVSTTEGLIRAEAPHHRDGSASVSFEIFAPKATDLTAAALNGPVHVEGLDGTIRATATNGPVCLVKLSGDVEVNATNGPVSIDLRGDAWTGSGLAVHATNGPITMDLPARYSARLMAETAQGPIVAPGLHTPRRRGGRGDRLDATLGAGGGLLTLDAHNGPVRIRTSEGG